MDGPLQKRTSGRRKKWTTKHFVLRGDRLCYYDSRESSDPKGSVLMSEAETIQRQLTDDTNVLRIMLRDKGQVHVRAKTAEEARLWHEALREAHAGGAREQGADGAAADAPATDAPGATDAPTAAESFEVTFDTGPLQMSFVQGSNGFVVDSAKGQSHFVGVRVGDVIVSIGGTTVRPSAALRKQDVAAMIRAAKRPLRMCFERPAVHGGQQSAGGGASVAEGAANTATGGSATAWPEAKAGVPATGTARAATPAAPRERGAGAKAAAPPLAVEKQAEVQPAQTQAPLPAAAAAPQPAQTQAPPPVATTEPTSHPAQTQAPPPAVAAAPQPAQTQAPQPAATTEPTPQLQPAAQPGAIAVQPEPARRVDERVALGHPTAGSEGAMLYRVNTPDVAPRNQPARRYREFVELKAFLDSSGVQTPQLPQPNHLCFLVAKPTQAQLESRREALEEWLREVAALELDDAAAAARKIFVQASAAGERVAAS
eukprot:g6974.t1